MPRINPEKEDGHYYQIWCAEHNDHPGDCFDKHHPEIEEFQGATDPETDRQATAAQHLALQGAADPDVLGR